MNDRNMFFAGVIGIITVFALAIFAISFQAEWFLMWLIGGCIAIMMVIASALHMHVRVKEMETAVVFSRVTDSFSRFLNKGQHLIKPTEYIYDTIITAPRSVSGYCGNVQTVDGITIAIEWNMTLAVDTSAIPEELQSRIARALPKYKEKMVRKHGNHCLRHLVNENTVRSLLDHGARPRLERQLRAHVVQRVSKYGLQLYKVMLTEISLPNTIQQAHNKALEREVTLMSKAREMAQFANLIQGMPESDRLWLTRLLQTYMMGENGVNLVMTYPAYYPPGQDGSQPGQYNPTGIFPFPPVPDDDVPNGIYGEIPRH